MLLQVTRAKGLRQMRIQELTAPAPLTLHTMRVIVGSEEITTYTALTCSSGTVWTLNAKSDFFRKRIETDRACL